MHRGRTDRVPVAELVQGLRELYPAERLLTEPARVAPYESDALTAFRRRPEAVVLPETREEVIETVRLVPPRAASRSWPAAAAPACRAARCRSRAAS